MVGVPARREQVAYAGRRGLQQHTRPVWAAFSRGFARETHMPVK